MERTFHGSQVSQPSKSLQGNFGLDEQYVELFIFPPGQQQTFDGCLNPILQQQQQHLWHKISRGSDFWNSLILLSLCSCNLILYCVLSSAAVPSWFSSIFLHLPAFCLPLSFCSILSPINVQNTFFVVLFSFHLVLYSRASKETEHSYQLCSFPHLKTEGRDNEWRSPLRQNCAPGLWDLMRIYECSKA